jgi:hypothetical protein
MATNKFLYRTEGGSLTDWGLVEARTLREARRAVADRMEDIAGCRVRVTESLPACEDWMELILLPVDGTDRHGCALSGDHRECYLILQY